MRSTTVISAALGCLATVAVAVPAQAASVPFTITESITRGSTTFTATAPLCPKGKFEDEITNFVETSDGLNLTIATEYICQDGSGSFYATKQVHLTFTEDGSTNTGPFKFEGGTGAYTELTGHGMDNGTSNGRQATGVITGVLDLGTG